MGPVTQCFRPCRRAGHGRPTALCAARSAVSLAEVHLNLASTSSQTLERLARITQVLPKQQAAVAADVYVQFCHKSADKPELRGSFNGWNPGIDMTPRCAGTESNSGAAATDHHLQDWVAMVPVASSIGEVQFKFVADHTWCTSPYYNEVQSQDLTVNNVRLVAPNLRLELDAPAARSVEVLGDWDGFQQPLKLFPSPQGSGWYCAQLLLEPGPHQFVFLVDGQPHVSSSMARVEHAKLGSVNQSITCDSSNTFTLYYKTGWASPTLHYRALRNGKPLDKEFKQLPLRATPSRSTEGGRWCAASVVLPSTADAAAGSADTLEFFLSNVSAFAGNTQTQSQSMDGCSYEEDRPGGSNAGGSNAVYSLRQPGSYKLACGQLRPFPRGHGPRFMLVSDIDGTVLPGNGCIDPTARLTRAWEDGPALYGSVLVLNTGRSAGMVSDLIRMAAGKLALPAVLITAVGTQVLRLNEAVGRSHAKGGCWEPDQAWTDMLNATDWNLSAVRGLADAIIQQCGSSDSVCKMIDAGHEHPHRIALVCAQEELPRVQSFLEDGCKHAGVSARVIVSGEGSHRLVDVVPQAAGKEAALQYVRQMYNIPQHLCVAAGDSGNDIEMLAGPHPAIVVGNAQPALMDWLNTQPQDGRVVLAEASCADGVLEGLHRFDLY